MSEEIWQGGAEKEVFQTLGRSGVAGSSCRFSEEVELKDRS